MSNKIREKTCNTYEVLLYIGSAEGYKGPSFSEEELDRCIAVFQDTYPNSMPVRVSACRYIAGSKYKENGSEISAIMYPNQLREFKQIDEFMIALAKHLLLTFKQNRITMRRVIQGTWSGLDMRTLMFESEEAVVSKSIQEFNKQ